MKRQTEQMILAIPLDQPICSIHVNDSDGNSIHVEQSLELGWGGDVDKCRKLYEHFLKQDHFGGFKFKRQSDQFVAESTDQGITIRMRVRGNPMQLQALIQLMKQKGPEYFDLTVKCRREHLDSA